MKKTFMRLTVLALLLAVVQGAWAQTDVSTEQALKEAIDGDGSNKSVKMTADIWLSSRLVIENGKEVTLDLNGHKLARSLKSAADDGNVIRVETGGTLTLKDGSGAGSGQILGGKAINGGGICNHGTLTLEGVTITDCYASGSGGGIYNAPATAGGTPATLTIKGGSVITNTCGDSGAGIFNYPDCPVSMQGEVTVYHNWQEGVDRIVAPQSNLYLDGETFINVTGSLAGSDIGVSIPLNSSTITSGYKANNPSADVSAFFSSDRKNYSLNIVNGEIRFSTIKEVYETVTCVERSWDAEKKEVMTKQREADCIPLTGINDEWQELGEQGRTTWYCVKEDIARKTIHINGEVHIVMFNKVFNLKHIKLEAKNNAKLHIHSVDGSERGTINVNNWYYTTKANNPKYVEYSYEDAAAIGGGDGESMGTLVVHGGTINADQLDNENKISAAAVIGGGYKGGGGAFIVYAGRVNADGNKHDIGKEEKNFLKKHGGPGIGAGYKGQGGDVHIYGGVVKSTANGKCSAIGGAYDGYYSSIEFAPNMKVTAGSVKYNTNAGTYVGEPDIQFIGIDVERVFTTAEREAACHYRTYALVDPCNHSAQNGDKLDDKMVPVDEFTHGTPCRYCAAIRSEEHQVPTLESQGKCAVCGRDAKEICFYLHNNDENLISTIGSMAADSQKGMTWNVMLKDHTFYHDGNWNTVVLPFELASFAGTPLEGATVERVKEATLSADGVLTINLEEVKALEIIRKPHPLNPDQMDESESTVGLPLFVKWPTGDNVTNPRFNNVIVNVHTGSYWSDEGITFQPLYKPLNITAENIDNIVFLGSDNRLGYSDAPRQLRAFHGYFHFDTVAGARAMNRAIINHGDGTTSVITPKDGRPITVDEFWYDLLGRRLDGQPTEKGLYIHKGKKIIVK